MNIQLKHGKIAVAVLAMLTLGLLFVGCQVNPGCEKVRMETILILLAIIGSMLSVDILGSDGGSGGGGGGGDSL